jgi:hypothetical protein
LARHACPLWRKDESGASLSLLFAKLPLPLRQTPEAGADLNSGFDRVKGAEQADLTQINTMQISGSFDARFISELSNNQHRVYVRGDDLYFINLGGLNPVTRVVAAQFGVIGMLIGWALNKRAKEQAETLLQRADGQDPEFLLRENKASFKVCVPEISEAAIEPPSFLAVHGKQAGRWNFKLRDGKKFRFEFENNDAMKAALDILPALLNATLRVNVEWNEPKEKFQKPKTHG